ncbi:MAG TPA: hypothetical protein VFF79_02875 [Conexibacter sp.]|nr:hypothetical protein [Conexibacter sp.]
MRLRRLVLWLVAMGAALGTVAVSSAHASAPAAARVLLVFVPAHQPPAYTVQPPLQPGQRTSAQRLFDEIAGRGELSLGLVSASQGAYTTQQAVLDISQGTRVSQSTYSPSGVPDVFLRHAGSVGEIAGWRGVLARAATAPQTIDPGLLAGSIPGGAGYVGVAGLSHLDAVIAADRRGRVAEVSLGTAGSIAARTVTALRTRLLVVADLPPDALGARALDTLLAARAAGVLVLVMQTPPDAGGHQLLPLGMTGAVPAKGLTSQTTTLPGLVAGIDLAPTVLAHLGIAIPSHMRGQAIKASGARNPSGLQAFSRRLDALGARRTPALEVLLLVCFTLLMVLGAVEGWEHGRRRALRISGLAFFWLPLTVLLGPIVDPSSAIVEIFMVVAASLGLAALTDRALPWPRGPMLAAFVVIAALAIDAAAGTHLLIRSILGPNPSYGSRFYGIGNELKSGLTCLLLIGLAAAFGSHTRSRRLAGIVALAGIGLGVIIGSARLGAGVGGVIVVAAGFATATLLMLPGRPSRRAYALALASPLLALLALALLDLATAGGHGHLTHNVLHAHNGQSLLDIVKRRTTLAAQALWFGAMPLLVLATLSAVWFARANPWLYRPLPDPMWRAALLGGLAAGIVGAFAEDSGPLLLIVAIYTLAAATAYIQGRPPMRSPTRPLPTDQAPTNVPPVRASLPS